jgi:hypothetical protein
MTTSTDNDPDRPVWGVTEISKLLNRTVRQTYHLMENGHVDASRVGGRWVTTKRRLLRRIAGDQ